MTLMLPVCAVLRTYMVARAHYGVLTMSVSCSWMHGWQQAGRSSCAEAGEAADKDRDDHLPGHHGQEGALCLLGP